MTFAAPGLLWLLPLAAAPIAVHLLFKRRRATIPFPSLVLLRNVDLRLSPRRRLREILLLAARTLFVVLLALAAARPVTGVGVGGSGAPVDHVLVLDNTGSMRLAGPGSTAFEVMKQRAAETLEALGPRDRAALLPLVLPDAFEAPALTNDRAALARVLEALGPTDAGADSNVVLERAFEIAGSGSAPNREVLFLSDFRGMAGGGDRARLALGKRPARTGLLLVDCASPLERPNASIALLSVDPPAPLVDRPVDVVVRVWNAGADAWTRGVGLELAGAPLTTESVTLTPGGSQVLRLRIPRAGRVGWTWGRAALASDAFAGDDAAPFVLKVRDRLSVVVVDPSLDLPSPDPEAPGRFLALCLDPSGDGRASGIEARRVRPQELRAGVPDGVDAVVLAGLRAAEPIGSSVLRRFAQGGGFVLAMLDPEDAGRGRALDFLPAWPMGTREVLEGGGSLRPTREDDPEAPAWRDLTVKQQLPLIPSEGAEVLLVFGGEKPALVVGRVGRGHAAVAGFSLTPAWGGFTFHPQVVATLHRLVARYAAAPEIVSGIAGTDVFVPSRGAGPAVVTRGDEALGEVVPTGTGDDTFYDLGRVLVAGTYALAVEGAPDVQRYVAVQADPAESDLARLSVPALERTFDPAKVVTREEAILDVLGARRQGSEHAGLFLLLAFLLALAEIVLGNRLGAARGTP